MIRKIIFFVTAFESLSFFLGAFLHSGLANGAWNEPRIIPAMIVEAICGTMLATSCIVLGKRKKVSWKWAVAAHIVAIAGVLLGIISLALGRGPTTDLNFIYHRCILIVLSTMLIILFVPSVKAQLKNV